MINSVIEFLFYFSWNCQWRADLYERILKKRKCLEQYICVGITAIRKPEVVRYNPAVGQFFYSFLDTR